MSRKFIYLIIALYFLSMGAVARVIEVAPAGATGMMLQIAAGNTPDGGAPACGGDACEGYETPGEELTWTGSDAQSRIDLQSTATPTPHGGSYQLEVAAGTTAPASRTYDFGEAKNNVLITFWVYHVNAGADWSHFKTGFCLDLTESPWDGDDCNLFTKSFTANGGTTLAYETFQEGTERDEFNGAEGNWYKCEIDYNRNASTTVKWYNSSEVLQDTHTVTAADEGVRYFSVGGGYVEASENVAFDDVVISYE